MTPHSLHDTATQIAALNDHCRATLGATDGGLILLPDLAAIACAIGAFNRLFGAFDG